ncbi:MAG: hypothetical protein WCI02_03345 [Planctomycetota bacterium]|jgi:hypothetical protein
MATINPYKPPDTTLDESPVPAVEQSLVAGPLLLSIEWTAILAFNLIVPILFAWGMTSAVAKLGMGLAIFIILLSGYYFCLSRPLPVLFVIRGGVLVALSQMFPVLQVCAGAVAMKIYLILGVIDDSSFLDMLSTGTAGFLVTMITGLILMGVSLVLGFLIRAVTPDRWWLATKSVAVNDV